MAAPASVGLAAATGRVPAALAECAGEGNPRASLDRLRAPPHIDAAGTTRRAVRLAARQSMGTAPSPLTGRRRAMSWIYLALAGLFEIGWAVGLKYSDGFTQLWPSAFPLASMTVSIVLLGLAQRA